MTSPVRRPGCNLAGAISGLLCLPLMLILAPNVEQSRDEARYSQALDRVMSISAIAHDDPDFSIDKAIGRGDLDESDAADPWGTPYRLTRQPDGRAIVTSAGSDQVFDSPDDFRSDLQTHPIAPHTLQKKRQLLVMFVVTATVWLVLTWGFVRLRNLGA